MPFWLFFFLATLSLVSAMGVILQANPVHCLLALAVNLLDMGIIFIGLGAVSIGLLQIIIYVGAIMVLFLFVIWLLNLQAEGSSGYLGLKALAAIGTAALAGEFAAIFLHAAPISTITTAAVPYGSISQLGHALFSDYLIAFEVTSLLLLTAVVGAIGLARRIPSSAAQTHSGEATQTWLKGASEIEGREQGSQAIPRQASDDSQRRERRSA
jgi:NADH-quinone oxidoreductase subunit J